MGPSLGKGRSPVKDFMNNCHNDIDFSQQAIYTIVNNIMTKG